MAQLSYRYFGVNLLAVEGFGNNTVMTLIAEVGRDIYKFKTAKEFTSWLRLSPNNKISGGKIVGNKTPKSKNILALALRNAANTIDQRKEGSLKTFFARIAYRKGRSAAITATARKLAIIVWNMITHQKEYNPIERIRYDEMYKQNLIKKIRRAMKQLEINGIELPLNLG